MKKYRTILLIISCFSSHIANGQKVSIGEKCPNVKLTTLMNYTSQEADLLTAFNDKPLIIDFWFIRCSPCLELMAKLDSLQKVYDNKFNILLVTSEKEEDIKEFFKRNERLKNIKHPIVYSAHLKSKLKDMFPHFGEPHEVWINKNGVVQAISSLYEVTPSNLEKFIRGEALNLPEKMDLLDSKYAMGGQPLLMSDEERSAGKRKQYYSWIGTADPMVPSLVTGNLVKESKELKIICQNIPIALLYQVAYSMYRSTGEINTNKSIKLVSQYKDTAKLSPNYRSLENLFCYEIYLRDTSESKIREKMQRELDNFFHLKSLIKQERVACYVLSKSKNYNNESFVTKEKGYEHSIKNEGSNIIIKNTGMYFVTENQLYNKLPYNVVNETGYNGNVDLVIPQTSDLHELKRALNKYGLDINIEERTENHVLLQDM